MSKLLDVQNSKQFQGRKELIRHLKGESLTMKQSIKAKCYDCMGFMADGGNDCEVPECSLYPFMPYRSGGPRKAVLKGGHKIGLNVPGDKQGAITAR